MVKFPDGTARVLVEGLWRIRIKQYAPPAPVLRAGYELLRDETEDSIELQAMLRNAHKQFEDIAKLSNALSDQVKIATLNTEHPGHFADLIAANLNLNLEDRKSCSKPFPFASASKSCCPCSSRAGGVDAQFQIQTTSRPPSPKRSVIFFCANKSAPFSVNWARARAAPMNQIAAGKIEQTPMPTRRAKRRTGARTPATNAARRRRIRRRTELSRLDFEPALGKIHRRHAGFEDGGKNFDEQHFGLAKVKDRLIEFIAVIKRRKQIKGPILCLVGPPGVGKTSLGKERGGRAGTQVRPHFAGGMRDEAEIRGHRRTYVGAMPGRIIQTLRRVESRNPVILLDELDKVGADFRGDPAAALLEVLDPAQNHTFTDHYLDLAV